MTEYPLYTYTRIFNTHILYPLVAVLQHALVGMQLFDLHWSLHSLTMPDRNVVLLHALIDAVMWHALVGTQFYDIP